MDLRVIDIAQTHLISIYLHNSNENFLEQFLFVLALNPHLIEMVLMNFLLKSSTTANQ